VSVECGQVSLLSMGIPPTIEIANIGMADSLILMVLALVVFGPRRLPEIGRQIGKLMYEFRKASNDFKFQMEEELRNAEDADRRAKEEAERQRAAALAPPAQISEPETALQLTDGVSADPYESETGTVEDPYSTETQTPAVSEPESWSGAEVSEAEPQPVGEVGPLEIQPPSTGEQVQAAAPNSAVISAKNLDARAPEDGAPENQDAPAAASEEHAVETASAEPEQAIHHG